MRAIVAAPDAVDGFRVTEVPDPAPGPGQVLVEVRHAAVNAGEVRHLDVWPAGSVLGHDAAGHVLRGAEDGSGPRPGDRVLAFGQGAWAQRAVYEVDSVAVVPPAVDLAEVAALPMVGLTALRTLRASGPLRGRRVLVTGASGGVGRVAVQLARHFGAYVLAVVGSAARGEGLAALGADEVIVGLDGGVEHVDVVLETVGGAQLVAAWGLLTPGGVLHSIGWASGAPAVFPVNSTFAPGVARTLRSFGDTSSPAADLALLVDLVARGVLRAPIGWRGSWHHLGEAVGALRERRVPGKILLDLD
ncbi:zinc-binding dehydrogenase [Micromonospora lupini]|uniref:zinc-binding dehydrogenase n=1 Tax=Micromonospora lupini TaxID=285679 RepID=UPI00225B2F85|nr:zinc-binding dehydrogenase [Micromonospora lupini]MCX5064404.1 zinc-binding dehydrogenase [Micromonospora lupini]